MCVHTTYYIFILYIYPPHTHTVLNSCNFDNFLINLKYVFFFSKNIEVLFLSYQQLKEEFFLEFFFQIHKFCFNLKNRN